MKIRILTEDGAAHAVDSLQHVLKRCVRVAFPNIDTSKIGWLPRATNHQAMRSGNKWRSGSPNDQRAVTELVRFIANESQVANQFVFFHFDGDCAWHLKENAETPHQFAKQIVKKVEQYRGFDRNKIIEVTPYYAIEACLYQNTERCRSYANNADSAKLDRWARDPAALDELERPHEYLSIGRAQNASLSRTLTNGHVLKTHAAQKSMHAFVEALQSNQTLQQVVKNL